MPPLRSLAGASLALICLSLLLSCSNTVSPLAPNLMWVVSWGASPENALTSAANPGGHDQSFRFIFVPTVAGTEERVHLSNLFGTTPLTVAAARLAVTATAPAIDAAHDAPLTFSGSSTVTIPAGEEITSDPVHVTYAFGQKLAVSLFLQGAFPSLTQHDSQVNTNFASPMGAGDQTSDSTGAAFTHPNTEWFVLTGVDVYGPYVGTVALFGSSSIDGHASNYGNSNSYPTSNVPIASQDSDRPSDWLARQLSTAGLNLGVLNAGTIGDPAGPDFRTVPGGTSIAGIARMKHDVLDQANVKAVIIYFGGIDLRGDCEPATAVEGYLTNMVTQAQAAGVRVILATLPPSEYCASGADAADGLVPSGANPYAGDINPGPENSGSLQRRTLNTWIRTSGAQLPGVVAVADFDKALADPNHPDFMIANLNSGDNFHPNGAGYGIQSAAVPLGSILGQ